MRKRSILISCIVGSLLGSLLGSLFGIAHIHEANSKAPEYAQLRPAAHTIAAEAPLAVPTAKAQVETNQEEEISIEAPTTAVTTTITENQVVPSSATYKIFAALLQAEAGNQDECGKRLVVDTVLNRVNDPQFPDTILEVIYQPYQFSVVKNGQLQKYIDGKLEIPEENYRIIAEELIDQVDYDVVFFQSGGWSSYGQPAYKYGDHYFNKW